MSRQLLMGIDIGTQSTRVALLDAGGRILASESTQQEMATPRPGWAEQDAEIWWRNVVAGIHGVLDASAAKPRDVIAVGVCGQMHAAVPVSAGGELLTHGVMIWCDKRAAHEAGILGANSGIDEAIQAAGNPLVPAWLGLKIRWLKIHEPEIYRKAWKIVPAKDYVNFRLTGQMGTDYSEASGSFLMDAGRNAWSENLASFLEIDVSKLPDIGGAYDILGGVSADAAVATGLLAGTPVVVGAGDMLCMLASAGLTKTCRAADVTGTASIMAVFLEDPVPDRRLMNLHHVVKGWIPFGIIDSGGGALKWFKDRFCRYEVASAERSGLDVYDLLNPAAASVEPGSEGLLFFPYLMGERSLGTPAARGVIFGATPRTDTAALTRGVMEGVTFELRRTLEIIEAAGHPVEDVYTIGGGARSDLWSQIKADIYHKRVLTPEAAEGGVVGSAALAGVGVGLFPDVPAAIERTTRIGRVFEPDSRNAARYDFLFELFKDLHDRLQEPFDRLARMP
jgi:xylulokinase